MLSQLERDRKFLLDAVLLAESARVPPSVLGSRVEPLWAAILASQERVIQSSVYLPGNRVDAVQEILDKIGALGPREQDLTLYLTVEPRAIFERLSPVTETIRRLNVRRVIIGAEDPVLRYRGEGIQVMKQMGLQVQLAAGEEARLCQIFLEDYSKALQRNLPFFRAHGEWRTSDSESFFQISNTIDPKLVDAVIGRSELFTFPFPESLWKVEVDLLGGASTESKGRVIRYGNAARSDLRGMRGVRVEDGVIDLGKILRDLVKDGLSSVQLISDVLLFEEAVKNKYLDRFTFTGPDIDEKCSILSRLGKVDAVFGHKRFTLKVDSMRIVERSMRYLEAKVELC